MRTSAEEKKLRQALIDQSKELERLGVNQGTSGNLSVRIGHDMLITPSAVPYDKMQPGMIARMPIEGEYGAWSGPLRPSSEWRIHLDIMRARPDVGAIIHTHSLYATTLSLLGKPIPAVHYMIAAFGGPTIRCTKYAAFGTKELSDYAVEGLQERHGVLLGQHGMVVTGADLGNALWRAVELETLAKMYYLAVSIGRPHVLADDEVMRIVERFKSYGYQPPETKQPAPRSKLPGKAKAATSAVAKTKTKAKPDLKAKATHRRR